ncbi:MAG: hypothetical protein U0572_00230 [Phycisphaerales bacterium]
MDTLFPFHLPSPAIWYVTLYVVTLFMHVAFMSYVLAGAVMLGVAGLRGMLGRTPQVSARASAWSPVTTVLKDWMHFALSAAITAGIAPLLFVQILYQQEFYTANLLGFARWMSILPVLIVAFYLMYLLKAHRIEGKTVAQACVALLVMACVLFVEWSWVDDHLLSLDRDAWPAMYASGSMTYRSAATLPRMGLWLVAAFPMAAALIAWQLRAGASGVDARAGDAATRALAMLGAVMTAAAAIAAWPVLNAPHVPDHAATERAATIWLVVASVGAGGALVAWLALARAQTSSARLLAVASVGTGVFWLGLLVAREAVRWNIVGGEVVAARAAKVGTLAGFVVFLTFAVAGVVTVGWIVRRVAMDLRRAERR